VDDAIDVGNGVGDEGGVLDVAEVLLSLMREGDTGVEMELVTIEDGDLVPTLLELLYDISADESVATGDKNVLHSASLTLRSTLKHASLSQ
jgi:hypothetical protein